MFSFHKPEKNDENYLYTFVSKTQILTEPQKYIDMQIMGWKYDFPLGDKISYDLVALKIKKIDYYTSMMKTTSASHESNQLETQFAMASLTSLEKDEPRVAEWLREQVDIVTIGQYLRPTAKHRPIDRYATIEEFEDYKIIGESYGIPHVESGPLVRSSYHAKDSFASV